jgi:exodeoxyribonuclease V alpha subunit
MDANKKQQIKEWIENSPTTRIQETILNILEKAAGKGICCIELEELIEKASKSEPTEEVKKGIIQMTIKTKIIVAKVENKNVVYLKDLWDCEKLVAENLLKRLNKPAENSNSNIPKLLKEYSKEKGINLHPNQEGAVKMAAAEKVAIMTGGPGCGKTFTASAILAVWKKQGKRVALCAPTGRAAAKLGEGTGEKTETIHKLLEYGPQGFRKNANNPIEAEAILIDESSMIDIKLMLALLEAIKPTAQILLVGDTNQLASIGPGKVLKDLMDSKRIPTTRLTATFRQGAGSQIITVAEAINLGQYPEIEKVTKGTKPESDCFLIEAEKAEEASGIIADLLENFLPNLGYKVESDVQLLCPMKKGETGTISLNAKLRNVFNPPSKEKNEIQGGTLKLRVGEKVIQTKNRKEIKNGDVGKITSISGSKRTITVEYPNNTTVEYSKEETNQLLPAWAISVHRSQGSDYPVAIVPMFDESKIMLNRNLLYTGITRGKKLVIIIGQKEIVNLAAQMDGVSRMTTLRERLAA